MTTFNPESMPKLIKSGKWTNGHVQGIAVDKVNGYIYFSFTTVLVKATLEGDVIGYVEGLTGHLGCLSFNAEDGKVYGSIEYKHDAIGKGILKSNPGAALADEDAFYIAMFDVDKIDRCGMHAEKDEVMTTVYLPDVVEHYLHKGEVEHKYGCSGIDGVAIGPKFGAPDSNTKLYVAYGIYSDLERKDNDYQVILEFDWRMFAEIAKPLSQLAPHKSGLRYDEKYFVYTGNTTYGIQNIEYDSFTGDYFFAVYVGKKPEYKNFPMFVIDGKTAPKLEALKGTYNEDGLVLTLKKSGAYDEANDVWGLTFPKGQTGMASLGDGYFYFSHDQREKIDEKKYHSTEIKMYKFTGDNSENPFVLCE